MASQFVSGEWLTLLGGTGIVDIATRRRHPESNGVLERLHRTHRTEGPFGADPGSYEAAVAQMQQYVYFYCHLRPHTALSYLPPAVWHFGRPEEALAARADFIAEAAEKRRSYWQERGGPHPRGGGFAYAEPGIGVERPHAVGAGALITPSGLSPAWHLSEVPQDARNPGTDAGYERHGYWL